MVFGHLRCRVIVATNLLSGGATSALTTPWQGRHLHPDAFGGVEPGLKWSQAGEFLLITHPEYKPRYLKIGDTPSIIVAEQPPTTGDVIGFAAGRRENSIAGLTDSEPA